MAGYMVLLPGKGKIDSVIGESAVFPWTLIIQGKDHINPYKGNL